MKNLESNIELDQNNITKNILNKLRNEEWKIIGGVKKWIRNCSNCNVEVLHSSIYIKNKSQNRKCAKCYRERNKKLYSLINNKKFWMKSCPSCTNPQIYKQKSHLTYALKNNLQCGKCTHIKTLSPNFNPTACKIFDKINEELGWNLRHAKNGGEVNVKWFFVDAYDKDRNIVIEYDEKEHKYKAKKDNFREKHIIESLNCKLIRIHEHETINQIIDKLKFI